ncbi:ABC transporter ATP-binding protein [Variovorax guangxiensis]|uniref:Peptide/nickel transport system ATP-binding protein n=1 Tax=Variovorax guangxiensis TaxID=1775474 RepID=A0A840FS57_9BURK|nr:ABC transporter ATP-binding protein [Variovorax guangxiensis]MBB4224873.1 peptide/nickel transport system ATP-binding protein [Variovorax guangxiensis]
MNVADTRETSRGAVLSVRGLHTVFETREGTVRSVDGVDLELGRGEILGLVGESGSGKSVTGYSIMGLVERPGRVAQGSVTLGGRNLLAESPAGLRSLRGRKLAMIFQDPMMTLNPVMRIDMQMIEAITAHEKVPRQEARERALRSLVKVGIAAPEKRLIAYPHELSGGMRQRVAIAIALLHKPDVIIADEPTTALDATIQGQILYEMQRLCRESQTALLWITHDLAVVAGLADRVAVMYAGRIVETAPTRELIENPRHPYSAGLIAAVPRMGRSHGEPLAQIPGSAPGALEPRVGCAFAPRCSSAQALCRERAPGLTSPRAGVSWRCWFPLGTAVSEMRA